MTMHKYLLIFFIVFNSFFLSSKDINTSSVMSSFSTQDILANSAVQQQVNGFYRTVELLDLIARDMGINTSSVMSSFSTQDILANSAYQQTVNGTYRTVELLDLIARESEL